MKRGFTLVELLAIFSIMSAIFLLSIPSITSMLKKAEETKKNTFEENVFIATEAYLSKNRDEYPELRELNKLTYVRVDELLGNYLNSTIITPKIVESKKISDVKTKIIVLAKAGDQYIYEYSIKYLNDTVKEQVENSINTLNTLKLEHNSTNINNAQTAINLITDNEIKEAFQNRLNSIK